MSETVLDVCGGHSILAVGERQLQVGGHRLGLACADTQQSGQVTKDEDAGPAWHWTLGVAVVKVENEHSKADGHRSKCHRHRQINHFARQQSEHTDIT